MAVFGVLVAFTAVLVLFTLADRKAEIKVAAFKLAATAAGKVIPHVDEQEDEDGQEEPVSALSVCTCKQEASVQLLSNVLQLQ